MTTTPRHNSKDDGARVDAEPGVGCARAIQLPRRRGMLPTIAMSVVSLVLLGGCQGLSKSQGGLFSSWRKEKNYDEFDPMTHSPNGDQEARNRHNIFRWLRKSKHTELFPTPPEAMTEFEAARDLYTQERYDAAYDAFKSISKKYDNTPIVEECQFMMAECLFVDKRYSWAQDGYEKLIENYPSTRHLDECTRRLFAIAQYWLNDPTFATRNELQQVSLEGKVVSPMPAIEPKKVSEWPIIPNLSDKSRPVFDTHGRALEALRKIWLHDPTGPLADDALMLSATYYMRKGDYREADRMLTLLREEYPKSPHLEDAFLIGSQVKLMSYQGANYDRRNLDDAEQLKKATLRLFGNNVDKSRLEQELKKIEDAKALREWDSVQYYMGKNLPHSAAVHAKLLIEQFPNSSYAEQARKLLIDLGPETLPPDLKPKKSLWSYLTFGTRRGNESAAGVNQHPATTDETGEPNDSPESASPLDEETTEIDEAGQPRMRRLTPDEAERVDLQEVPDDDSY